MSYHIRFKVKVEGIDKYVEVGACEANTTWNVREMIRQSTDLEWMNCANNGLCKEIIPHIEQGYRELTHHPEKYIQYEAENGWGTVESTRRFFEMILDAWQDLQWWEDPEIAQVATFWIE